VLWKVRCGPEINCWIETEDTDSVDVVAAAIRKHNPQTLSDIYIVRRKGERVKDSLYGLTEWALKKHGLWAEPGEPIVEPSPDDQCWDCRCRRRFHTPRCVNCKKCDRFADL